MSKNEPLNYYLGLSYPVMLYPEKEGGYTVAIADLPGCLSQGETVEEALEMIEDARRLWIASAHEAGEEIPVPSTEESFSGRVLLRMPRALHKRLVHDSKREAVSLNQHITRILSEVSVLSCVQGEIRALKQSLDRERKYHMTQTLGAQFGTRVLASAPGSRRFGKVG